MEFEKLIGYQNPHIHLPTKDNSFGTRKCKLVPHNLSPTKDNSRIPYSIADIK